MGEKLIEAILKKQAAERAAVIDTSDRAHSALALAIMAKEHRGDGSHAAASLLLSMERGTAFDFRLLLKLDTTNRAHADLVMLGYQSHYIWPSRWIEELGVDGNAVMQSVADAWPNIK